MVTKRFGRIFLVLVFAGLPLSGAFADEVVHFTNGAAMTVRSHVLENDKSMVKLDLGGNSFIAFPMAMVEKIVNAGRDVYLNPGFHPSNQAVAGSAASSDMTVRGMGNSGGAAPQPDGKGHAGVMLGEAADKQLPPDAAPMGALTNQTMANSRRKFNPAFQAPPGGPPQIIMPPTSQPTRGPVQLTVVGAGRSGEQLVPVPAPPANNPVPAPENPPAEDPAPEDPPENP